MPRKVKISPDAAPPRPLFDVLGGSLAGLPACLPACLPRRSPFLVQGFPILLWGMFACVLIISSVGLLEMTGDL